MNTTKKNKEVRGGKRGEKWSSRRVEPNKKKNRIHDENKRINDMQNTKCKKK